MIDYLFGMTHGLRLVQACMTNFRCSEPDLFLIRCRTGPRIYLGLALDFLGINTVFISHGGVKIRVELIQDQEFNS